MNIDNSIEKINSLVPKKEQLIGTGMPLEEVNYQLLYSVTNKKQSNFNAQSGSLDYFYSNYIINERWIIGYWISIDMAASELDLDYIKFGFLDDGDYIILNKKNGKIYIMNYYSRELTYICADNFECFIAALVYHADLFWRDELKLDVKEEDRLSSALKSSYDASFNYLDSLEFYKYINGCTGNISS